MKHKSFNSIFKTCICVLLGNAIFAFCVAAFIMPHNIITGGVTGIGIVIGNVLSIDTAMLILIFNIVLLIFGGIILGKKFFITTVASSLLYPVMLSLMQKIPGITKLTDNHLLAALFTGGLMGLSLGMVMRVGSSTGGTDVISLVLHKWFHIPVSVLVYILDIIIVGGQGVFSGTEQLLLGILVIVLESLVLEQVMIFGKSQIQVFVVSSRYEELRGKILNDLQAGVTMTLIETGCFGNPQKGVLCVIPPRKLYAATELIHSVDNEAFITITKIKEVQGRGFTMERQIKTQQEKEGEKLQTGEYD